MLRLVLLLALLECVVSLLPASFFSQMRRSFRSKASVEDDDVAPELAEDVRDFRARLISRSKEGVLDAIPAPSNESSWAYETPLLEQGSVLLGGTEQDLGFAVRQQYFHKCIVLLLQHDENFTRGLILNRPSLREVDGWSVWFGGDVCEGALFAAPVAASGKKTPSMNRLEIECLTAVEHADDDEFVKVVKGIWRTSFDHAKELVEEGKATREDFWIFAGYAGWGPDQLQNELERGTWYLAAADGASLVSELLKTREISSKKGVDDGTTTWKTLMTRIGHEKEALMSENTLDDDMLRAWVDARLDNVPDLDAKAFSRNSKERTRAEENLKLLKKREDETVYDEDEDKIVLRETVARGSLLAAQAVGPDLLLDRQFLHHSLLLVVASSSDIVVLVCLNRPSERRVALEVDKRTRVERSVAFGGDLAARGAPGGVVWIKRSTGDDDFGEPLPGPVSAPEEPACFLCSPKDVANALSTKACKIDDLLPVCGVVAWPKEEFKRLLGNGALLPLKQFPWNDVFDLHGGGQHKKKATEKHDNGIAAYRHAIDLNDLSSSQEKDTALADRALRAFSDFFLSSSS